jgi:hypothetical protein
MGQYALTVTAKGTNGQMQAINSVDILERQ